jgi:glucokinase
MIIDPDGPPCGCGKNGHVESFCSGPAIARYVDERIQTGEKSSLQAHPSLSAAQVAEAALKGDPLAISAFARAGHYLGIAVANYLAIFDPSILIFGGGVIAGGRSAVQAVRGKSAQSCVSPELSG